MNLFSENAVLIVGPGAIGQLLAVHLHQTGATIGLLDHRPDRAARIQQIRLLDGACETVVPVTCEAASKTVKQYGKIIVCVKAFATKQVAATLAPHVNPAAHLLTLQNGLGNGDILNTLPCKHNVRVGITSYGAYLQDETTVCFAGEGIIQIAATRSDAVAVQWQQLLQKAGFRVQLENRINDMLWTKLILNAALNPVTALFGLRNGDLPAHPDAWKISCAILKESVSVANALGIPMDASALQGKLQNICQTTRKNRSSMLVDLQAGRKTEVEAINGAIISAAKQTGQPYQYNQKIMQQVLARHPKEHGTTSPAACV